MHVTTLVFRQALRQPLCLTVLGISLILVWLSYTFGLFNFADDDRMRMLYSAGIAVASLAGLFLSVLLASSSISDEFERKTVVTLLAKPLPRWRFLLETSFGNWLILVCTGFIIGAAHIACMYLLYREEALMLERRNAASPERLTEILNEIWFPWEQVAIAHFYMLFHGLILCTLASCLALRLGLISAILACTGFYLLGHLLPAQGLNPVFLPVLDIFLLDSTFDNDAFVLSTTSIVASVSYAFLFSGGILLIGLAGFERQDIS